MDERPDSVGKDDDVITSVGRDIDGFNSVSVGNNDDAMTMTSLECICNLSIIFLPLFFIESYER